MGEYAKYRGESIKIGTCESMYYLRADQRHLIEGYDFAECLDEIRFRFPFPSEDAIEPGQFDDHDFGVRIPGGWSIPADFDHYGSVQFSARPGYLLSLPCPEGPNLPEGLTVHKNGWGGGYRVKQTKHVDGEWWTVVACGSCSCAWRLPREIAATVAEAFLDESERQSCPSAYSREWGYANSDTERAELQTMAERILAGYRSEVTA